MVRFENVGLRYGVGPEVLRDVHLALAPGSFHFLTGLSGAGKSSLLSLLYLARRPTRGRIHIFGRDMAGVRRRDLPGFRRRIGVVFQDFRLLDHLTALDNVGLPLRVAGVNERTIRTHVGELLAWVGMADRLAAKPPTLSGGEKQRVAIARAVITRPQILLADEPTGNVDDEMALKLLQLFGQLHKMGTTVLIATHNQSLVARLGHPELRLEGGHVAAEQPRAA